MLRRCLLLTLFGGFLWSLPTYAEDRFGHVDFGLWSLDWEINDDTGLALRNVFFDHGQVLAKASMPMIRVKSDKERTGGIHFRWVDHEKPPADAVRFRTVSAGPTSSRSSIAVIRRSARRPTSTAASSGWRSASMHGSGNTIFIKSVSLPGRTNPSIVIAAACHATPIMCTIRTGDSMSTSMGTASTKSSGTTRMPRTPAGDRDGTSIQMRSTTPSSPPPIGCGSFATNPPVTAYGLFPDLPIVPSLKNSTARDVFSDMDIAVRRNKRWEDEPWPFAARGELAYDDGEGIQEQDIVFWYVGHLPHIAALGPTTWLVSGPTLRIAR